jgi:hypothetical protein
MTEVRNNTALNRFELDVDGHTAVAYYRPSPGLITFTHTGSRPNWAAAGSDRRWCAARSNSPTRKG